MNRLGPRDIALLSATTLLGLALRLFKLDASLWYDEVITLVDFVRLPVWQILTTYTSLNNHLFFTLQAHLSIALFGEQAWALRLPALIFGVATIPALFHLVRLMRAPLAWAHLSALLLALSYHHIWFSQNARGYTGLVFWCLITTIAFVQGSRRPAYRPWIAFSLAAAAAMFTHLSAAFFVASLGLCYAIAAALPAMRAQFAGLASAKPLLALPLTIGLVLLLHAGVIPDMLAAFTDVATPDLASDGGQIMAVWRSPIWTVLEMLRSLPLPLPLVLVVLPVVLLVLVAGFVAVWRLDCIVALVIPISIVVTFSILIWSGMNIWPRYFLADLPFLLVLATAGTATIASWITRAPDTARRLTMLGWIFGIIASSLWASRNYVAPKQDFAGAVALVNQQAAAVDQRASLGLAIRPIHDYFAPDWTVVTTEADLDRLMQTGSPVWITYAFDDHSRGTYPALMARIDREFERVAKLAGTLGGGTVYVMRSLPVND